MGVVLCAKVKKLDDGEYGLFVVAGVFENKDDKKLYTYSEANTVYKEYMPMIEWSYRFKGGKNYEYWYRNRYAW